MLIETVVIFVQLLNIFSLPNVHGKTNGCGWENDNRPTNANGELLVFDRLKPLFGKRYRVDDPEQKYTYMVGICSPAVEDAANFQDTGAVQIDKTDSTKQHKLGKFTEAKLMTGSNWVYLEYMHGDNYHSHCSQEQRRAVIMITCDETVTDSNAKMVILEENMNMTEGCYYLFELSHRDICPGTKSGNLSLGSIFIIVLFSVIAVYLFFGFLYQRFVLGAKGMEQIPNYGFWQDFGNLQADGCNFVCRTGENRGPRTYKGVGDDQLEEAEERDDHLLPM